MSKITNETVKKAIDALQAWDKSWYTFFTANPVMINDDNNVDFKSFFAKALGEEKFLFIDKIENNGKNIFGNFKTGKRAHSELTLNFTKMQKASLINWRLAMLLDKMNLQEINTLMLFFNLNVNAIQMRLRRGASCIICCNIA